MARDIAVRRLEIADAPACASLHSTAFPGSFLTTLGHRVLVRLYRHAARDPAAFGALAEHGGAIVGVVFGVTRSDAFFRGFYRRHALPVALAATRVLAADRSARTHARTRVAHLRHALGPRRRTPTDGAPSARLLSIAVAEEARGAGAAEALVDELCAQLARASIDRVGLSVRRDNQRAIAFYDRSGWRRDRETDDAITYWRPTRVPPRDL